MLCRPCRESFKQRMHDYGLDLYFADHFLYCHHEEEKPKEKCWCEYPEPMIQKRMYKNSYHQWVADEERPIFCPDCGRRMK